LECYHAPDYNGWSLVILEHVQKVVFDYSFIIAYLAFKMIFKSRSCEPDVAQASNSDVAEKDHRVSYKDITLILFWLCSVCDDWWGTLMEEIASA